MAADMFLFKVIANVKNKRGYTVLEAIPFIIIMFVLLGATLGCWGLVHTAILHSIASRHGSFVYFNNRSDVSYLRDFGGAPPPKSYYGRIGWRFSYIQEENNFVVTSSDDIPQAATLRPVDFTRPNDRPGGTGTGGPFGNEGYKPDPNFKTRAVDHNSIWDSIGIGGRNRIKVAPAWVMVGYGICLNAKCDGPP